MRAVQSVRRLERRRTPLTFNRVGHLSFYTEVLLTVSSPQTGPSRYWYLQQSENNSRTGQSRYWYLQQSDGNSQTGQSRYSLPADIAHI